MIEVMLPKSDSQKLKTSTNHLVMKRMSVTPIPSTKPETHANKIMRVIRLYSFVNILAPNGLRYLPPMIAGDTSAKSDNCRG